MAKKLGEMLIEAGLIDRRQLEIALAEQAKIGSRIGSILADLGFTTEEAIGRALAEQSGVQYLEIERETIQPEALRAIPEALARRREALPVRIEDGALVVAMANPTDIVAIDEIQQSAELFVRVVSAGRRRIVEAIERAYGRESAESGQLEALIERALKELDRAEQDDEQTAIVDLVREILQMAVRRNGTDVHFQPDKRVVRVRFRIDGDLVQGPTFRRELLPPVVARIKVMSDLDISESRIPQDGKIRFPTEKRAVDLRISTFPSVYGESVVVRILDKERQTLSLEGLGLSGRDVEILSRMAARPYGLVLAAGPTGSGKSTTLYALLRRVDASQRQVITLEDPVEYEMPLVTQCQVNDKAGLTFESGLRAILRHDPDVILVGEMRDLETASMALRAALTGHLVFSTIHTNDAVRSVYRLMEMGLDGYIVASCLSAVAAQRLVRLICEDCREEYEPRADELAAVGLAGADGRFARGRGCERCNGSGHRGREALFEVLEVGSELAALISRGASLGETEEVARASGLVPFPEVARRRARQGRIALAEVARVAAEV